MMITEQELVEFLAWMEDNFTHSHEDCWLYIHNDQPYTREQIVQMYVTERRYNG